MGILFLQVFHLTPQGGDVQLYPFQGAQQYWLHLPFPVTIMDSGFSNRGRKYQTSMIEVQALLMYDAYSK